MKILVIAEKEKTIAIIKKHLIPFGFETIVYSNPVKAIDNIPEIKPDLVLFSAEDYPRHWKIFLTVLRNTSSYEECFFIILKTDFFSAEDVWKASFLGVNGLLDEDLDEYLFTERIKRIISKYLLPKGIKQFKRYFIHRDHEKIDFIFNHPETMELVFGQVAEISIYGISVIISSELSPELKVKQDIGQCSIKISDNIITVNAIVHRSGFYTAFIFDEINDNDADFINSYFENKNKIVND